MEPKTVSTVVIFADPKLLDLAYRGREILRALGLCKFYKSSDIAEMVHQPKRDTLKLLKELNKAHLILNDPYSDPSGRLLYGLLPSEEDIREYGARYRVIPVPASKWDPKVHGKSNLLRGSA
jgi:hypothetical protein